jgi:hypothetical protein
MIYDIPSLYGIGFRPILLGLTPPKKLIYKKLNPLSLHHILVKPNKMSRVTRFFNSLQDNWKNIKYRRMKKDAIAQECDLCDDISKYVMWIEEYPEQKYANAPVFFCHKHYLIPAYLGKYPDLDFEVVLAVIENLQLEAEEEDVEEKVEEEGEEEEYDVEEEIGQSLETAWLLTQPDIVDALQRTGDPRLVGQFAQSHPFLSKYQHLAKNIIEENKQKLMRGIRSVVNVDYYIEQCFEKIFQKCGIDTGKVDFDRLKVSLSQKLELVDEFEFIGVIEGLLRQLKFIS